MAKKLGIGSGSMGTTFHGYVVNAGTPPLNQTYQNF
jgi:hypothetical protein